MEILYKVRDTIIIQIEKVQQYLIPIIKFCFVFTMFYLLTTGLNHFNYKHNLILVFLLSIVSTVLPYKWFNLIFLLTVIFHLVVKSVPGGILVSLLLVLIYFLFVRMWPYKSVMIYLTILFYLIGGPVKYLIPFVGAIFFGFTSIVPVVIGNIIYFIMGDVPRLLVYNIDVKGDPLGALDVFGKIYKDFLAIWSGKLDMLIFAGLMIIAIAVIKFIIDSPIKYSNYIGIGSGFVVMLLSYLIVPPVVFGIRVVNPGLFILYLFIAAVIAVVIEFFNSDYDYKRIHRARYEDGENYYFVTVVPKRSHELEEENRI